MITYELLNWPNKIFGTDLSEDVIIQQIKDWGVNTLDAKFKQLLFLYIFTLYNYICTEMKKKVIEKTTKKLSKCNGISILQE